MGPQPGTRLPRVVSRSRDIRLSATACARHARPVPRAADGRASRTRAWGAPTTKGHRTPIQPPLCPLIGEHCPAGRGRKRFLAPGAQPLRDHRQPGHPPASPAGRYEQPEQPHRMTRGGSSWSRTFSSSARPPVSSARRVAPGRLTGSAGHALPLISTTTCATSAPRAISQRQPRTGTRTHVPAQVRTDLPAHRCEATTTHTAPGERPRRGPAGRAAPPSPARRHAGSPETRSQSVTQPGRRRAHVAAVRCGCRVCCGGPEAASRAGDSVSLEMKLDDLRATCAQRAGSMLLVK